MTTDILLISSSRVHGQRYMGYCEEILQQYWQGVEEILFIPFALQDHAAYTQKVAEALAPMGLRIRGIETAADFKLAVSEAKGIYIGGGNTFLLTHTLYRHELLTPIRERILSGAAKYMGSSAGSNVACPTMKTTNDMPIVYPPAFDTLNLVPFQINAHYLDPATGDTHQGETREERIREFHQWNMAPVLGLREGALLHVQYQGEQKQARLKGVQGAKLFRAEQAPQDYAPGDDLSFLL
jgi:dipeptidase E